MADTMDNFVTVVSVGTNQQEKSENINFESNGPGYVTVLTIGDDENNKVLKDVTEEVIVYRLPGERLGFGLKFEGGTKASEFVKRLFIQSCAADSPASRVKSSWGKLTEGDEVLEIDSIPVNTMTRIDCVRCLKDSNVAIKLMVRHIYKQKGKIQEEPPQVPNNDEKRTPPPPPPVPPRKIPRKLLKNAIPPPPKEPQETIQEPAPRPSEPPPASKSKKLQSPRGSIRSYYSPDVPRRDRRFSDGSLGPPDAEVYVDLFLQESTQSLSESDDTGSTISTVIDRFGSFPTTTTSSFSGSLPSTPTAVQRHLDLSNISIYDDEDIMSSSKMKAMQKEEINNNINSVDESNPLCFQDAPLSYGNESTKIIVPEESELKKETEDKNVKKPPVPPRARDSQNGVKDSKQKNEHANLPRLVDFVPKSSNGLKDNLESSTEIMKLFLENERYKTNFTDFDMDENDNLDAYNNGMDLYSSKWSLSSQLATIGEVEEDGGSEIGCNRPSAKSTPLVIVEHADCNNESEKSQCQNGTVDNKESHGIMATLPSDPRQPPDGHEFPDFIENNDASKHATTQAYFEDKEQDKPIKFTPNGYTNYQEKSKPSNLILCQSVSTSNTDLRANMYDSTEDLKYSSLTSEPGNLHTRSQSLIDMSSFSKQKNTKWNQLMEQRRKGLSKLKGLVIPEASENEVLPSVSIPEIKSQPVPFVQVPKIDSTHSLTHHDSLKSSIIIPPWPTTPTTNLPKYSPAFKRKSLQVYPTTNDNKSETSDYNAEVIKYCDKSSSRPNKLSDDDLNPPKSLESISSPTRSDCSFDYVSTTKRYARESGDAFQKSHVGKIEDESDNDSAVSSSQSSYNSRFSPPPSPTRNYELNHYKNKHEDDDKTNSQNRLLKPSSVEAINRKNILASAKCRSGKDLKIGSPVIRRKQEENHVDEKKNEEITIAKEEILRVEPSEVPKLPPKIPEIERTPPPVRPAPRNNFVPPKPTTLPPRNHVENFKENKITKDLYTSRGLLSNRVSKPINVKALKENFENFGATPPPLPQKAPIYKQPAPTRNVRAEIAKTENKIEIETIKRNEIEAKKEVLCKPRKSLELKNEEPKPNNSTSVIVLNLEALGGSLGITLAGGTDYESKEITVHRIRYGSVAYHDGRLKRGDKIVSVNGKSTIGLTHIEAMDLLKEPVTEFSIEIKEGKETVPFVSSTLQRRSSSMSVLSEPKNPTEVPIKKATDIITVVKDGAGLGFSIEGGKDSPQGDVPLTIKKIFTGGAADKCGQLKVGDEVLSINDISFASLTRIEAWTLMKKIPEGVVNVHIFR